VLHGYRYVSREEMERLGLAAFLRNSTCTTPRTPPPKH
jgi:hypothetical protein